MSFCHGDVTCAHGAVAPSSQLGLRVRELIECGVEQEGVEQSGVDGIGLIEKQSMVAVLLDGELEVGVDVDLFTLPGFVVGDPVF